MLRADLLSAETRALLTSVARVVLVAERGRLSDQLDRVTDHGVSERPVTRRAAAAPPPEVAPPVPDLEFFNGLGGFADGGREYVTILGPGQSTPAPWINVVANPTFGFQVAAEGGGSTWSVNSREHQLTPWSNDPVSDQPGEAFYLRDDDTGDLWSPTALPIREEAGDLRRPPRPGIQPLRAHVARDRGATSCSTCRSTTRSRSRASRCATRRAARGVSR